MRTFSPIIPVLILCVTWSVQERFDQHPQLDGKHIRYVPMSTRWTFSGHRVVLFSVQVLHQIARLCEELWIEDPACRLTSINVKKQLKAQVDLVEHELANTNTDSQQQSTANNGPWTA